MLEGHPNYDVHALASAVCSLNGWRLMETRFYTGVPNVSDDPLWNRFWSAKLPTIAPAFQPTYEAGSPRPDDIAAHIGNLAYQPEYPA